MTSRAVLCLLLFANLSIAEVNVLTANYNNFRTNANLFETHLNTSNVNTSKFALQYTLPVEGQVYAQPLFMSNLALPGRDPANLVFLATMDNNVYAYDVTTTPELIWFTNVGPPVPSSDYNPSFSDVKPNVGVLSTPVIDPASQSLFLVAATRKGAQYTYKIHVLDLASGRDKTWPVEIAGTVTGTDSADGTLVFDPFQHLQRPGLLLTGGLLYIAFGSRADLQPCHGWIFAYDVRTMERVALVTTTPDGRGGSIWQSGHGLTVDENGALYAITANGSWDGVRNLSQSFLKLSSTLAILDWFTPDNYEITNEIDDDFGSMGAIAIPGTQLVIGGGKDGFLCVIDTNSMGQLVLGNTQIRQRFAAVPAAIFDLALWNRDDGPRVFVQGLADPMASYRLVAGRFDTIPVTQGSKRLDIPYQGMAISANGSTDGTGILWVTSTNGDGGWPGTLTAYDATDLQQELWNSDTVSSDKLGGFAKFVAPTVAEGKVFVPTFSNKVAVYGLNGPTYYRTRGPEVRPR